MRIDVIKKVDAGRPIQPDALDGVLYYGDENAHRIIAEVWKNGQKADLTGAGVQGYVVRSDGTTVILTDCGITTDGDGDACRAYGVLLPDISDLLAELDAMQAATAALAVDKEQTLCAASLINAQTLKMDDTMSIFRHRYYYLNGNGKITASGATTVDVRTTQKLVAVPGDTISVTLSETATGGRLVFAVFDKDGNLSHSVTAAGVDTMVSDEYTFGTGDAYFWLSGRYGKRASFAVTYTPAVRE